MSYVNHSGGALGADMCWENEGKKYGVESIAYSFYNHTQYSENQNILSNNQLKEGWQNVLIAEKTLKRNMSSRQSFYVKNLLSRNWFQVKNSEAIFAVGSFLNEEQTIVNGGTGWAVQMAIDNEKPVFFFNQPTDKWYEYSYTEEKFIEMDGLPTLTENFAGIGSRNLEDNGKKAIEEVYKFNFKNHVE